MKTYYNLVSFFKGSPHSEGEIFVVPIIKGKYACESCKKCLTVPFKVKLILLDRKIKQLLWLRDKSLVQYRLV